MLIEIFEEQSLMGNNSSTTKYQEEIKILLTPKFSAQQTKGLLDRNIFILILGFAAILLSLYFIYHLPFFSSKKSIILNGIAKGELVQPYGKSAYDTFLEFIKTAPSKEDINEIANAAVPLLELKGNEFITRTKNDGVESLSEADWITVIRLYDWLNQLKPSAYYSSHKYFAQACQSFIKKDYNSAIDNYKHSSELDAAWSLPLNGLGRSFVRTKDKTNARDYYRRATEIEPAWLFPWINLSGISIELNDYSTAEMAAQRALSIDPKRATAHYYLGIVYEKSNRFCDAYWNYQQAFEDINSSSGISSLNVDDLKKRITRLSAKYNCPPQSTTNNGAITASGETLQITKRMLGNNQIAYDLILSTRQTEVVDNFLKANRALQLVHNINIPPGGLADYDSNGINDFAILFADTKTPSVQPNSFSSALVIFNGQSDGSYKPYIVHQDNTNINSLEIKKSMGLENPVDGTPIIVLQSGSTVIAKVIFWSKNSYDSVLSD